MKDWWLDELRHAGPEHLDASFVDGYDRKQQFDPTDDVELLRRHGLDASSLLVDFGAGTGTFALAVAATGASVVAVDIAPAMVTALGERTSQSDNIRLVEAGFLTYEHHGPSADFVYCRNALHQLPDFWKGIALDRIARLLKPGGVLLLRDLVYDMTPQNAVDTIEAWLDGAVPPGAVGYTRADLAEHVAGEHSTYTWLFEALLDRTGFDIVDKHVRRSVYASYTCRRRTEAM